MEFISQSHPLPNDSESFRTVPQPSESFGKVPQAAETFRSLPNTSDRSENHKLSVRDVARMFETAGVARTERSIVNWCQPNRQGLTRLDAYLDPNERKYLITPQSVELAIQEELAKASQIKESARAESVPHDAEIPKRNEMPTDEAKELRQEIMDLKITNRAKDMFIEQIQKEREGFALERRDYVEKLMTFNRKVGELESNLRQLSEPTSQTPESRNGVL
jgi:hypothetical protein